MNRLADETSPYLQQHAQNPVDWYPWGEEALSKAREEGKPIFLSIGYSACHWCHVMERESFEDPEIAEYLNEHFVSIKVDREERPDVDNIYMEAVQVMAGHGGWPMSVFLRPDDLAPFFAGTYFPPEDRWQRPGFRSVLEQLVDVWENDPDRVEKVTGQVTDRLQLMASTMEGDDVVLALDPIDGAVRHLEMTFDAEWGGFGDQPKFPPSMQLRLLLHVWADDDRDDESRDRAIDIVEQTLVQMASGGMYDQIGGGFHRYSVDREWLVPHFEKMLYDNALLTLAYTEGYQATGRTLYERVVRETVDYLTREMASEDGAFYSSQDADSEGEEGKFFVWTPDEVREVLGDERGERAMAYWGIEAGGNFEGKSIPNRLHAVEQDWTLAFDELPDDLRVMRDELFAARQQRVAPGTDTKVLAAWNGLTISAIARAGAVFGEPDWIEAAARAATFVLETMQNDDGLHRTYKDGRVRFPGYLDDYAFMAAGCFDLFEANSDLGWLERSEALMQDAIELFWDDDGDAFFYTADHHTDLLVRQKESYDGAVPSSNSIAVMTLLRLSVATGRNELRDQAHRALQAFYTQMKKMPRSLTEMMQALDFHVSGPNEIVCVTPQGEESLAAEAWLDYRPNAVIFDVANDSWPERVPVARERGVVDGAPTVYVCHDGVCELPRNEL